MHAGHQDRFDLGAENVAVVERNPHRAPAHEGVVLGRRREVRKCLVTTDIKGADGDRLAAETFDNLAIKLVLVEPVGEVGPGHVGELGPVEADPLGAVAQGDRNIADQADVGPQGDCFAVSRNRLPVAVFLQTTSFEALFFLKAPIFIDNRRIRVDVEGA